MCPFVKIAFGLIFILDKTSGFFCVLKNTLGSFNVKYQITTTVNILLILSSILHRFLLSFSQAKQYVDSIV